MATPDPTVDFVVRQMRDAIVDNDLKLMQAVNRRLELVSRLRAYKHDNGIPFVDPEREDWMHKFLQSANRGPITAEGLRELFEHVLSLSKAETTDAD